MIDSCSETQVPNLPQANPLSAAPSAPPMYLIVLAGGIPGSMIHLLPGGTRIGRAVDNTLQFTEGTVSRHHAIIRTDEEGVVWLTDLASTNGTYLNHRRIKNHTPTAVADGDQVQFGSASVVKFSRPDVQEEQFHLAIFERSVRDALTGLYNRTYFLEQINSLADRVFHRGLGLGLLMLDIDHFKTINDTLGHEAGDTVLREVAEVLRSSTRPQDLVARYGGEEFVAALPIASLEHASSRAEQMRQNLAERPITAGGHRLRVTASIGVAFASKTDLRSPHTLLAAADLSLYQAKNAGRNRVICFQGSGTEPVDPLTREEPHRPSEAAANGSVIMNLD